MNITFSKYHGTGNDFIIIDNRSLLLDRTSHNLYAAMCHRRFGIGADGLILIQHHEEFDFEMVYFNSDGRESSMCGNGGRCIAHFAAQIGMVESEEMSFLAIDGPHEAKVNEDGVALLMSDVKTLNRQGNDFVLNTGSPHYVRMVNDIGEIDVFQEGRAIRQSPPFAEEGINVNFIQQTPKGLKVATYERGVEDETYSCGTGVVASGIVAIESDLFSEGEDIPIITKGGHLKVNMRKEGDGFKDVWLMGPAIHVFDGIYEVIRN